MAESHVVSGLRAKQEEIRRRIFELEKQSRSCRADLHTISEALRIFGEPDKYAKEAPFLGGGDRTRIIFDALRESPNGLDTKELALIVMKAKRLDLEDAELAKLCRLIGITLHRLRAKGRVKQGEMRDGVRMWQVG